MDSVDVGTGFPSIAGIVGGIIGGSMASILVSRRPWQRLRVKDAQVVGLEQSTNSSVSMISRASQDFVERLGNM